jgi:hypothetical protein
MALIVALTGAAGFWVSFVLLQAGLDALWFRYSVAVAVSYLAFLFLLWCWLRLRKDDLIDGPDIPFPDSSFCGSGEIVSDTVWEGTGGASGGGGASGTRQTKNREVPRFLRLVL